MSEQKRPTTEWVEVCDLCGEPVDTYGNRDRYSMYVGQGGTKPTPGKKQWFHFYRWRHGDRASGAPDGDYRTWSWDFHGECLADALMPIVTVEARKVAGGD